MPTDLNAGWIFFFNTEARSSGFLPLSLSEGKTKSSAWLQRFWDLHSSEDKYTPPLWLVLLSTELGS
jgi:hypothetical protein